jgi:hypothetical protein
MQGGVQQRTCARERRQQVGAGYESLEADTVGQSPPGRSALEAAPFGSLTEEAKHRSLVLDMTKGTKGKKRRLPGNDSSDEQDLAVSVPTGDVIELHGQSVGKKSNGASRADPSGGVLILSKGDRGSATGPSDPRQCGKQGPAQHSHSVLDEPSRSELREQAQGRINTTPHRAPHERLAHDCHSGSGPVARQSHVVNEVKVDLPVQLDGTGRSIALPAVVVTVKSQQRQAVVRLAGNAKGDLLEMDPCGLRTTLDGRLHGRPSRRHREQPDVVMAGRGHHRPIPNLWLRTLVRLT